MTGLVYPEERGGYVPEHTNRDRRMSKPPKWIRKGFVEIVLPPDGQFPTELLALVGTSPLDFLDAHGLHLIYTSTTGGCAI